MTTLANVWDALSDSPEEAESMSIRSLMLEIREAVKRRETTQAQAARLLNITPPRLNDLLKGKIEKFSLETIVILAKRAGLTMCIDIGAAA